MLSTTSQKSNRPLINALLRQEPLYFEHMSSSHQSGESSRSQGEDWRQIPDQTERRKIQNRIAQRKYRDKEKRKREDDARIAENQQAAGSAYATPNAKDLAPNANPTGLPWGSVSIKHVLEAGKAKEQAQQASREGSAAPSYHQRTTQG